MPGLLRPFRLIRATLVVAAVSSLVASGCKKPDEDLGLDLLPGDPLGTVVDTVALHAFTFADTSIRTSGLSRHLVGSYLDPQFGLVKAGLVTQVRLSANNIGAGMNVSGLVADSLVLSLAYDGATYGYGNLNPQLFQVYELNEALSLDSGYRSDRMPVVFAEDLVAPHEGRITPQPTTKPYISGDSLAPQLRIKLSSALAQRFIGAFGTASFTDNDAFGAFFRGLYVTVDNGQQSPYEAGILYFNLIATDTKVTLYYRDLNDEPTLTRELPFLINSNCVRYTTVVHDFTLSTDGVLPAALQDSVTPSATVFVQTLGGTRTAVRFPNLLDLADLDQVLAKAELIMPLKGTYYPYYPPPAQLFIFRKDTVGVETYLPDQFGGLGLIDGNFRQAENAYHFNITRYVQRVLDGSIPNTGIEILAGSTGVTANRVVLSGPADGQDPMLLRLTFTSY